MSIYNADELVAPAWINQEFLEKVLSKYENKSFVEIIKFDISPASMKGDHYGSIMFRCKVSYRFDKTESTVQRSLIIKTLPLEEGQKRELLMDSQVFETEINMYSKTLPKIEKILAECGEPTRLSAEIIYHSLEPHKVIILEDLCELGFDTVRNRYLNEDEVKAVYRKIAKLHAVSYKLGHSGNHNEVTHYEYGMFNIAEVKMSEMVENGLNNFIDTLSCYDELDKYSEKVKIMRPHIKKACKNLYNAYKLNNGKGDIFVLNHGDFHIKNFMFKYDKDNKMEDVIFVDYQLSSFAPSTIDTTYSQYMILNPDLRLRRNEFMYYYFMEFIKVLKQINYQGDMPLYSEFQMASIKYRHYSVFLVSAILPMIIGCLIKTMDELKDMDTTKFFESPDMIAMTYKDPEFLNELRRFMPILLREGYLD